MFEWLRRKPPTPEILLDGLNTLFAQLMLLGHLEEPEEIPVRRVWTIKPFQTGGGYHIHRTTYFKQEVDTTHHRLDIGNNQNLIYVSGPADNHSRPIWFTHPDSGKPSIEKVMADPCKQLVKGFNRLPLTCQSPLVITVLFETHRSTSLECSHIGERR